MIPPWTLLPPAISFSVPRIRMRRFLVRNAANSWQERALICRVNQMDRFRALYSAEGKNRSSQVAPTRWKRVPESGERQGEERRFLDEAIGDHRIW